MKFAPAFFALCATALALPSAARANLLLNGDFETLVGGTATGDNYPITLPDWIVSGTPGGANDPSLANLVLGTATGEQSNGSNTSLPSYQDDGSTTHHQSLDGVDSNAYVTQAFTLGTASALEVSAAFGGRDYNSGDTSNLSNWTITGTGGNAAYAATGTGTAPTFGQWAVDAATTDVFPAGNYVMTVTLADPDQLDAVIVNAVPEPSSALGAVAGGLCLLGLRLRRSGRR